MKRASYRAVIRWIVDNDDTEFMNDLDAPPSVSVCLVADLFGVDTKKVENDLGKLLEEK